MIDRMAIADRFAFRQGVNAAMAAVSDWAEAKGWKDQPVSVGELVALTHSELSEFLDAYRKGNPESEKMPALSTMDEEIADVMIRLLDMAARLNIDLAEATLVKMAYNETRPYRHGGRAL